MSLLLFQFKNELLKLFARKRTYIGFGVFLAVELLILFMLNRPKPQASFRSMIEQSGYGFEEYFSGLTLGFMILMYTILLLGALYLALVAGDVVAKEVEDGTMRMMLCRPISRTRILLLKYFACVVYTFALIFFIGLSALLTGILYKGLGGLFAFSPMDRLFALHELRPGLERYFGALPLLALSLTSVTSLGFLFSCLNMKPAAATIVTLSIIFLDSIFRNIPYFESLQPYFITTHMGAWLHVMENYIPWQRMAEDYAYLLAVDATLVIVALAAFHRRDFKA
jgi:ABC-2 type transport system permease protein